MTTDPLDFCPRCDRTVLLRAERGVDTVTWRCGECGAVVDVEYDDELYLDIWGGW
jgi:ribosomal protein L37AE/L43A